MALGEIALSAHIIALYGTVLSCHLNWELNQFLGELLGVNSDLLNISSSSLRVVVSF